MTETLKGQVSKDELEKRQQQEEKLKGFTPLQEKPPYWLSTMAKNEWERIYPYLRRIAVTE